MILHITCSIPTREQGYLAHKKPPPQDPIVGLCSGGSEGGRRFRMGEVPL